MNLHRLRQPETPLQRASPAYRAAIADFERALARMDEPAMQAAWDRALVAAVEFRRGKVTV